ncbi:cation efflux system protein CzcA [Cupriavidus basilensis OR16]|uniref:Cation efflux system protein CzcA n=1 Tax=Cupriavidus basilensis OR16 TaxID=1127483 RepID=H1SB70_9BURK|nr:cation efflux system protein CzcA [Cupriavidus basilensis OR16]
MFERLIRFAIEQRWLVLLAVIAMATLGIYNYSRLPIDAVPDITNVQVQVNTSAPGYSPLETEQRVTYPIETAMSGLPGLEQTRSLSRYGLSQVTVIFKDGTDIYFARQLVNQRIQEAAQILPAGVAPARSPPGSARSTYGRWKPRTAPGRPMARPTRQPTCARSRTGSSSRNCAPCQASPRSTPSAASPRNTWWRPARNGWRPTA